MCFVVIVAQDYNKPSRKLNKFSVKQNMTQSDSIKLKWKLPVLHEILKVEDNNSVLYNFADNEIATGHD